MIKFSKDQTRIIHLAINTLVLENYIENYFVNEKEAHVFFDELMIEIIAPMDDGALQLRLINRGGSYVDQVLTDSVIEALPLRRLVLSLFGSMMLHDFRKDWSGFSQKEYESNESKKFFGRK